MKCNVCGFDNPKEKNFCQNCGKSLNTEKNSRYYHEKSSDNEVEGYRDNGRSSRSTRFVENQRLKRAMRERQMAVKRARVLSAAMAVMIIVVLINTVYISVKRHELANKSESTYTMQEGDKS